MGNEMLNEVIASKKKYETEIEEFLREKMDAFTEETGVFVQEVSIGVERIEYTHTGLNMRLYEIPDLTLKLDWEGSVE